MQSKRIGKEKSSKWKYVENRGCDLIRQALRPETQDKDHFVMQKAKIHNKETTVMKTHSPHHTVITSTKQTIGNTRRNRHTH